MAINLSTDVCVTDSADTTKPATPAAKWALFALALTMLLSSLGTSIANVGLPTLGQVFDAPFQKVQWVVIAYLLAITTLIVGVGCLGDVIGRRRLMLIGIAVFTAASVGCGLTSSLDLLIAARALQGLGAAAMMALTLAFVAEAVPKERIGHAMGLLGMTSSIGTALGPTLGGLLIAVFDWRAIFLINVPLGVIAWVLAAGSLPRDRPSPTAARGRFDLVGMLVLALTLGAYALAMTLGRGSFGWLNAALLLAAGTGLGVFVWIESRVASPLVPLAMLENRSLSAAFLMNTLIMTVVMATLIVGPFYLSGGLGLDAAMVGLVMSAGPLAAVFAGMPAGRGVDRFGARQMTLAGLAGMAIGCLLLSLLPRQWGILGYLLPLMLITASYALFQTANNTAVMSAISADQRGVVSGLLNLSRNLGLITGAALMGAVYAYVSARVETGPMQAAASGMRATFAVGTIIVIAALMLAFASARGLPMTPAREPAS